VPNQRGQLSSRWRVTATRTNDLSRLLRKTSAMSLLLSMKGCEAYFEDFSFFGKNR
jgi:hypothetical protein